MATDILLPFVPPFQVHYNANALFVQPERPLQLSLLWAEEVDWIMVERFEAAMLIYTGRARPTFARCKLCKNQIHVGHT